MLTEIEYLVLNTIEPGLPLVKDPYAVLANEAGLTREEFCLTLAGLKERGIIRRMAVVLRHHQAGVRGNIMAAFKVPSARLDEIAEKLAQNPAVSHCYARQTVPAWPYNLYAMLHAPAMDTAVRLAQTLCQALDLAEYVLLPTVAELKKSSFVLPQLNLR